MIQTILRSPWFPWFDLACALAAGALWFLPLGHFSWLPLLAAIPPWLLRLQGGLPPFRRTPFDALILLFLVTAGIGAIIAYDQQAAWRKFWLIVGSSVLYYSLAGQPRRNLWPIIRGIAWAGVGLAVFFLLTHDWQSAPPKFEPLGRITAFWMAIRPSPTIRTLHPNVVAGLLAVATPCLVAWAIFARKWRSAAAFQVAIFSGGLVLVSLLLAASRGAVMALTVALGSWLLWLVSGRLAGRNALSQQKLFLVMLVVISGLGLLTVIAIPGGAVAVLDNLPGPASATSRQKLALDTLELIDTFSFTGGGLAAFPGLYSQYIHITPFFFLPNGHNILLDAALEQSLWGAVVLSLIFLRSFWVLNRSPQSEVDNGYRMKNLRGESLIRWAVAASMIVLLIHGLVEDTVYGSPAILGLFVLPGLVWAVAQKPWLDPNRQKYAIDLPRPVLGLAAIVLATLLILFFRPLQARWYANVGALEMARVELAGWPTGGWDDGSNVAALASAEHWFNRAVEAGNANWSAYYRLGLIAMQRRDFESAVAHLELAHQINPDHRGIRKSLGYAYAWSGRHDEALPLLVERPEAPEELANYSRWWNLQGRRDLAQHAAEMGGRLANIGITSIQP
jgi:hypothetical protein